MAAINGDYLPGDRRRADEVAQGFDDILRLDPPAQRILFHVRKA